LDLTNNKKGAKEDLAQWVFDAPLSSSINSIVHPRVKTTEGEGVGVRSLTRSTLGVEGRARAPGWD